MFLEELVEQHRVYLVVADAVGFSFFVAHHQVRIHLLHIFGHKPKLRLPAGSISFLYWKVTGEESKRLR